MSKICTHLAAGGLNLSAGFSPITGARVAAVQRHTIWHKYSLTTVGRYLQCGSRTKLVELELGLGLIEFH